MRPALPGFNPTNHTLGNAIVRRYFTVESLVYNYCHGLFFRELGGGAALTPIRCAMTSAVSLVRGWCIPPKIGKNIVRCVAVIVAALRASGRRANECPQHHAVNAHQFLSVVTPQHYMATPSIVLANCFEFAGPKIANAPLVGNFIVGRKTNNRKPSFHKSPISQDKGIFYHGS